MDRSRKKCGSIGHPYTIPTTEAIRIPETRRSTLIKENGGVGTTSQEQIMPSVGHKHSLSEDIPDRREKIAWITDIKDALSSTKFNTDTLELLIG